MKWVQIFMFYIPIVSFGQIQYSSEDWVRQNFDLSERSVDNGVLENQLEYNFRKLDLNRVKKHDLQNLHLLTDNEIDAIIEYRSKNGNYLSIYELQVIKGFSISRLKQLQPFIYVPSSKELQKKFNGYTMMRMDQFLEKKIGYSAQKFLGSPQRLISRTRLSINKFHFGLTLEKDPGEQITWKRNYYGVDHISGFVMYKGTGLLQKVVVGNFITLWGQGLVNGGGFGMGKGREPILSIKRNKMSLAPYSSISEYQYFTGVAFTLTSNKLEVTGFASKKLVDGTLIEDTIQSLPATGIHRNSNELEKRKSVQLTTVGLNVGFVHKQFRTGISIVGYRYNREFPITAPGFRQKGIQRKNILGSISYQWRIKNLLIFGESAMNSEKRLAHIHGGMISLSHSVDAAFSIRSFSTFYYSPFSNQTFRESSKTSNEKGTYLGIKIRPSDEITLNAFADIFSKPWMTSTARGPSSGTDYMINVVADKENYRIQSYFRFKSVEKNYSDSISKTYALQPVGKAYGNVDISFDVGLFISFRMGIWYSNVKSDQRTTGSMLYHDIKWKSSKTSITGRFALIDVPYFENRFYVYEPDVLYAFSVPVYYGKSIKYFILLRQKLTQSISFWAKGSMITFRDRKQIGSGPDTFPGNKKTEIKVQFVWVF